MPVLPLVDPIERAIHLRTLPMFEGLSSRHVARLARLVEERSVPAGTVVCEEGAAPGDVLVVVEGTVRESRGEFAWNREAPAGLGGYGLLAGEAAAPRVVAAGDLRVLALPGRVLLDLLQEDIDLMLEIRSLMMARIRGLRAETGAVRPPWIRDQDADPAREASPPADSFAERVRLLAGAPIWGAAYLDDIAEIALHSRRIAVAADEVLWLAGEPAEFFAVVTAGSIRCTDGDSGTSFVARRGDTIGAEAILGSGRRLLTATAEFASAALAIGGEELLQIVAMRPSVGLTALRSVAQELLQLEELHAHIASRARTDDENSIVTI